MQLLKCMLTFGEHAFFLQKGGDLIMCDFLDSFGEYREYGYWPVVVQISFRSGLKD